MKTKYRTNSLDPPRGHTILRFRLCHITKVTRYASLVQTMLARILKRIETVFPLRTMAASTPLRRHPPAPSPSGASPSLVTSPASHLATPRPSPALAPPPSPRVRRVPGRRPSRYCRTPRLAGFL